MKKWLMLLLAVGVFFGGYSFAEGESTAVAETLAVDFFDGSAVYPGTEEALNWLVTASSMSTPGFPKTVMANTWPKDKYGDQPEGAENKKAFSINAAFDHAGANWIEIRAGRNGDGGSKAVPVPLQGRVSSIGMWVWGSNHDYTLEAVVIDTDGLEYRLPMGNLKFMGWRHLIAQIPVQIKQKGQQYPWLPQLRLRGFVVTASPKEKPDNFYIYLSDVTTSSVVSKYADFDGSELTEEAKVAQIWASAESVPSAKPEKQEETAQPAEAEEDLPAVVSDNPAFKKLTELSVDSFEDPTSWNVNVSSDVAYIKARRFEGAPAAKKPLSTQNKDEQTAEAEQQDTEADKYVVGVKMDYVRRAITDVTLMSTAPLHVNGVVKVITLWAAGRNMPHKLSVIVRDVKGNKHELYMGTLNYAGWKQLAVSIPSSILQSNPSYAHIVGLDIIGFKITTSLLDTTGSYYAYFDDLRVWADLYPLAEGRRADDLEDKW
jgi:hypothetical protein